MTSKSSTNSRNPGYCKRLLMPHTFKERNRRPHAVWSPELT
jgi:hypothetical protein